MFNPERIQSWVLPINTQESILEEDDWELSARSHVQRLDLDRWQRPNGEIKGTGHPHLRSTLYNTFV